MGGTKKRLERELLEEESILIQLQGQVGEQQAEERELLEAQRRVGEIWDRLDCYTRWEYPQRLHREGDKSGKLLAWLLNREIDLNWPRWNSSC